MKKGIFLLLVVLPLFSWGQGRQARLELVALGGVSAYSGDVGGNQTKFLSDYMDNLGPAVGLGMRLHVTNFMALRANFNYAMVSGSDSLANGAGRVGRNLSFRSPIYEGSLLFEISLFNWKHLAGEKVNSTRGGRANLYIFGGMSFFSFKPQAYYQGRWYDLQPLGTEGQGIKPASSKYELTSTALVMGLGYRYLLGGRWSIGFEGGLRKTNTDYLDDVSKEYWDNGQIAATYGNVAAALADRTIDEEGNSVLRPEGTQRGSSKVKDYFGFAQITLAVKLGKDGNSGRGGGKRFKTRSRCFQF